MMMVGANVVAGKVLAQSLPVPVILFLRCVLAMLIMLPALTVFGNYVGMVGGWTICHWALNMSTKGYIHSAIHSAHTWDLYSGLVKSVVFAWLTIIIACDTGLRVEGGAEGVGAATTNSVVHSLLCMLIANAVLTSIFFFA